MKAGDKRKVELIPLAGADIEGIGKVYFGKSEDEVKRIMGEPENTKKEDSGKKEVLYYLGMSLLLQFDEEKKLDYIELSIDPLFNENIQPVIYTIDPFDMEFDELVGVLKEKNDGEADTMDPEHRYEFPDISVSIWREATLDEVEDSVEELKYEQNYLDEQQDLYKKDATKADYISSIGIGTTNYFIKEK
jgi:hypothetical protein